MGTLFHYLLASVVAVERSTEDVLEITHFFSLVNCKILSVFSIVQITVACADYCGQNPGAPVLPFFVVRSSSSQLIFLRIPCNLDCGTVLPQSFTRHSRVSLGRNRFLC